MEYYELYHHGIKGQKWGVRRYQNSDGTLTSEGKKHKSSSSPEQKKKIAKRIALGAAALGTAAAAAYYVKKHPEAISKIVDKVKNIKIKDITQNTVNKGKNYISSVKTKKADKKARIDSIKKDIKSIDNMPLKEVQERLQDANARSQLKRMMGAQLGESKGKKIAKALGTAAATTGTALTLYNNLDRMKKIANETQKNKKRKNN